MLDEFCGLEVTGVSHSHEDSSQEGSAQAKSVGLKSAQKEWVLYTSRKCAHIYAGSHANYVLQLVRTVFDFS